MQKIINVKINKTDFSLIGLETTTRNNTEIPHHGSPPTVLNAEMYKIEEKPPLQQYKLGILIDKIQCKDGLTLLQKYDGSPACVTFETKQKLIERGWAESHLFLSNSPS